MWLTAISVLNRYALLAVAFAGVVMLFLVSWPDVHVVWMTLALYSVLELFFLVMYLIEDGRLVPIKKKLWDENPNIYTTGGGEVSTLFDRFLPHPFLGHVNHDNPPAGRAPATKGVLRVNGEGFIGPEFPPARSHDRFLLMISGGSVAERFAQTHHSPDGVVPPMLEEVLNERYLAPDGMSGFTVLNGAVGGWKQPQQLFMLCLHAHLIHAFVTLEGYNETMASLVGMRDRGFRFEYPWLNLYGVDRSPERKLCLRTMRFIHRRMGEDVLFSRSRLAYWLSVKARDLLDAWATRQEARTAEMPTTFNSLFARTSVNIDPLEEAASQYTYHVQGMKAVADLHGVRLAAFMQPCAGIGKKLSPRERSLCGRSGYEEHYRRMERAILEQGEHGMHTASLVHVFDGVDQDVYIDDAHFNPPVLGAYGRGLGHQIVAERMADQLATWWGFVPRVAAEEVR